MAFIHTHLHTQFSNYGMRDAISSIDDVIAKVDSLGQKGFAITDHNGASGLVEAYIHLQKYNKEHNKNLKLLWGTELYYTPDVTIKDRNLYHILFLAKNETGRINMNRLITEAHKHYYYKSRCDLDIIKKYSEGLICTSACMGGWLRDGVNDELIKSFKNIFGEDLYLELHTYQNQEQFDYNKMIVEASDKYNLPLLACCDSHYVNKEDYDLHKRFRGISESDEDRYYQSNDFYIQSEDEVRKRLSYIDKKYVDSAILNTIKVFDKCNVNIDNLFGQNNYPRFVKNGDVKPVFLNALRKGYKEKILGKVTSDYKKRVDERLLHEIDILEKVDYMDYLLITKDILDHCRDMGIPIGIGRGSIGGCECAYLLGITQLNAIDNNLYFERFANPSRVSPADIDNDVSQLRRGEVIDYIRKKYIHVHQCRTFNYMRAKGALKDAGRALGLDFTFINNECKKIDMLNIEDKHDGQYELMLLDEIKDISNSELVELAKKMVGIMTSFGKHASAVIVANQDITKFCALERQVDSQTHEEVFVTNTNFKYLEEMGLLKEDVLGLRTLDVINECLSYVDNPIPLGQYPWKDEETSNLLCKGDTLGVFQMASHGMKDVIRQIKPKELKDMIAIVALYRPACILGGTLQEYIDRRNGKPFKYLDDRLEPVLKDTYGIMLYQEDVMAVVRAVAGYSMAEADTVRRAIGKKNHELMAKITSEFVSRAIKNGYDADVAQKILDDIIASGSYSFNKSHSQSYGYTSWVTAYLKAHYPLPFYLANINSEEGNQEKILPFIQECKRKGIKILPVDLRYSENKWTIEDNSLRMGLAYPKGLGHIEKPKEYTIDAIYRKYNKKQLESLVKSGALDFLGDRKHLFAIIEQYKENYKTEDKCLERIEYFKHKLSESKTDKQKITNQNKIDEWTSKLSLIKTPVKSNTVDYPLEQYEFEVLGYTLSNPLDKYDTHLCNNKNVIAAIVTKFIPSKDKNGNSMAKIETLNGNRYMMFYRNYQVLEPQKAYYLALHNGNVVVKAQELELLG